MTALDPPAAAARRQNLLDRWIELLIDAGCDLDRAQPLASRLLDVAQEHGYSLPTALDGAPLRGGGSTAAGRTRARLLWQHRLDGERCAAHDWHGAEGHAEHLAHVLAAAGVATIAERLNAPPPAAPGSTQDPTRVPEVPPNSPEASEGVQR